MDGTRIPNLGGHRPIIGVLQCFKFSLETRATESRLESKIDAKFQTFCHFLIPTKSSGAMSEVSECKFN